MTSATAGGFASAVAFPAAGGNDDPTVAAAATIAIDVHIDDGIGVDVDVGSSAGRWILGDTGETLL